MLGQTHDRLLDVYKKLRDVVAGTSNETAKHELVEEAKTTIREICHDHVTAAQDSIKDPELRGAVCESMQDDCQELIDYIIAAKRFNLEVNARSKDRVVGFGEKLSCRFMTAVLKDNVGIGNHRTWQYGINTPSRTLKPNTSISRTFYITTAPTASVRLSSKTQRPSFGSGYMPVSTACPSSQVSSEPCLGV